MNASSLALLATLAVAVVGTLGTLGAAWITVWPRLREQTVKKLREEIDALRGRVESLEAKLDAEKTMTRRLIHIIHTLLDALDRHEPGTVDEIRRANRDLDL